MKGETSAWVFGNETKLELDGLKLVWNVTKRILDFRQTIQKNFTRPYIKVFSFGFFNWSKSKFTGEN